ncbi:ATP-binding cassette subfamily B protein [Lacrimispora xylanisolvens]|uniref:ATP-binding cassette subfamily B protein n=1 Tax=Lacrimispora xylanisolvens TaxID=384636 RepID=A0A2S6HQ78_9FIRM|nr:ABC transporter ATP-binding protein [Hungatella xylanolytica]PPK79727.1 ATP-binding cassette subfamily B protein [Hungatella xylanolytica]
MNQNKQHSFGRLVRYLFSHYKIQLIVTLICIVISSFSSSIATIFIQRLIDECITPGVSQGFEAIAGKFTSILLTMGFIYICGTIASVIYNRIMAIVTQGTLKNLRNDMFNKMQTLPVKYFDTHAHGDIMSTYTNDTDAIRQLIGQSLPTLFQSALTITVMFLTMLYYSIWLTLVVMIVVFLMLKITKKLGSITATFMIQQQKSLAKEEGFIEEMMQGQKVVKVFCHEEENKEAFKKLNEQLFKDGEKANQNGNVLMPILGNVGNLMYVLLAVIGGLMVYLKAPNLSLTGVSIVSIGIIVSFLGMSRQLSQTIGQASMQVSMIAMGLAGATRVFELMDEQPEEDHGYVTLVNVKKDTEGNLIETKENTEMWAWKHPHQDGTVTLTELTGDVRLEDVDFGYVPDKLVLNHVSLFAKPGQKIAFVGATGAGKTTITNLINRFYDIMEGKIRYDGINISKIKKPALRSSLGVVLQDVNLFTGSVMDNIRYGRLDATDEECIAAAKLANADDFITRLPDGYETILTGNGSSLSQGQRQLISIARAAVADPPAMILDEATSSIDTRTEALVQAGMDNLMKGRTVFVIAHRLSTVKNSDAIMVLDHGKIIERGSHESLIEQKGTYYQLYTGAFELE